MFGKIVFSYKNSKWEEILKEFVTAWDSETSCGFRARDLAFWNSYLNLKEANRICHVLENNESKWTAATVILGSAKYYSFMEPDFLSRPRRLLTIH